MATAIKARQKGDIFQSRWFWLQALQMATTDHISSITFESDGNAFVDDVIVRYVTPTRHLISKRDVLVDYFQCKYHVTANGSFNTDSLLDPDFIGSTKDSMLQRLFKAYVRLSEEKIAFGLNVVSSWSWDYNDPIASHLEEGTFRESFFAGGNATKLGKLRARLEQHLGTDSVTLRGFLGTIHFRLGQSMGDLAERMVPLLRLAGLRPIDRDVMTIQYDAITWVLFERNLNTFTKLSFYEMAKREKLIAPDDSVPGEVTIRSRSKFAREPRTRDSLILDLTEHFDERHPKKGTCWGEDMPTLMRAFFEDKKLAELPKPVELYFDCHLSFAFAAGYLIDPKYGIPIVPTQRNHKTGGYDRWPEPSTTESHVWEKSHVAGEGSELVVAFSVTNPIGQHLLPSLTHLKLDKLPRLELMPKGGSSRSAVATGELAWSLGHDLQRFLRSELPAATQKLHVFFAGPAGLAYILGNTLRYVAPRIQLYEHDFEGSKPGAERYTCSLSLPFTR